MSPDGPGIVRRRLPRSALSWYFWRPMVGRRNDGRDGLEDQSCAQMHLTDGRSVCGCWTVGGTMHGEALIQPAAQQKDFVTLVRVASRAPQITTCCRMASTGQSTPAGRVPGLHGQGGGCGVQSDSREWARDPCETPWASLGTHPRWGCTFTERLVSDGLLASPLLPALLLPVRLRTSICFLPAPAPPPSCRLGVPSHPLPAVCLSLFGPAGLLSRCSLPGLPET